MVLEIQQNVKDACESFQTNDCLPVQVPSICSVDLLVWLSEFRKLYFTRIKLLFCFLMNERKANPLVMDCGRQQYSLSTVFWWDRHSTEPLGAPRAVAVVVRQVCSGDALLGAVLELCAGNWRGRSMALQGM